jgi:hypothetical protein
MITFRPQGCYTNVILAVFKAQEYPECTQDTEFSWRG